MPDDILASNGLYSERGYAMELARSIAEESGYRTRVRQFRSRLWEISWASIPSAARPAVGEETE